MNCYVVTCVICVCVFMCEYIYNGFEPIRIKDRSYAFYKGCVYLSGWAPGLRWADSGRWRWGSPKVSGCAGAAAESGGLWSLRSCQTAAHLWKTYTNQSMWAERSGERAVERSGRNMVERQSGFQFKGQSGDFAPLQSAPMPAHNVS